MNKVLTRGLYPLSPLEMTPGVTPSENECVEYISLLMSYFIIKQNKSVAE